MRINCIARHMVATWFQQSYKLKVLKEEKTIQQQTASKLPILDLLDQIITGPILTALSLASTEPIALGITEHVIALKMG